MPGCTYYQGAFLGMVFRQIRDKIVFKDVLKKGDAMISLSVNPQIKKGKIDRNIYGHFAEHLGRCIYEGIWVGNNPDIPNTGGIRNDVVEALKEIRIPVLRWPGGCFADDYHWKDGIGPREKRPVRINAHWGGVTENNHFGTHEFMEFCGMIGCEPYICGNVGSGSVQEMREWIEYMTCASRTAITDVRRDNERLDPWKIRFFGIGNENWGCGGNMSPEYYADEYKRYSSYVRHFPGNTLKKIACGPNSADYNWTETVMKEAANHMDCLSLHYYTVPGTDWNHKGDAVDFTESEWYETLKKTQSIDEMITKHSAIMDRYDADRRIGLIVDEWGTWFKPEHGTDPGFLYQQNTVRDALVAGINFNIFHKHCRRVRMANIAQLINVLQAVILTDNGKMILTPTYHVFNMYKVHQDAELIALEVQNAEIKCGEYVLGQIDGSASVSPDGKIHLSLCNLSPGNAAEINAVVTGIKVSRVSGSVLTGERINDHNTFDEPDRVKPQTMNDIQTEGNAVSFRMPAASVVVLEIE
jgi:alpha-L-arabinofuranosidase